MRRMLRRLFLCVLCLLLCTGCMERLPTDRVEDTVVFVDARGVEVKAPISPRRVAVLFSSFAEIWQLAGGEIAVTVGETVERGFAQSDVLLVDAGAGKAINIELLLAAEPELVICSVDISAQKDCADFLDGLSIPVAALSVETFEDYLSVLSLFCRITGNDAALQEHGLAVQSHIEHVLQNAAEDLQSKRILFVRAATSARATKAKRASDHFAAAMLSELGCENIADRVPQLLGGMSMEAILEADPDAIFLSPMGDEEAVRAYMDTLLAEPVWQSLRAVQNGCVFWLPKELFQYKPNERWGEAYETLYQMLCTVQ